MKKKKLSFILNISIICLAIVAIVVGVYSLRQAKLNINGSVGFKAHNCLVTITGKYKAYTADNLATRTETDLEKTEVGGSTESEYSKTLQIPNTLYFSDLATDNNGHEIVFELTITNNSDFEIKVKAPAPTLTKDGTAITDVICASSNTSFKLDKNASQTITLTFTLSDISTAKDIDSGKFNIDLSFEKYVSPYFIQSITEDSISSKYGTITTNKLCLTIGHSIVDVDGDGTTAGTDGKTKTPLIWSAFAVKEKDNTKPYFVPDSNVYITTGTGEKWYSLFNVDMSAVDYEGYTFWFIQQYVIAGGYLLNDSDKSCQEGILFNSKSDGNCNNTYAQIGNNIKSNIFKFLNSEEEYVNNGYIEKTGITIENQNMITEREVNEKVIVGFSESEYNVEVEGNEDDGIYTLSCQFSSKFWLINFEECGLLCNQIFDRDTFDIGKNFIYKTYGINNQDGDNYGEAANWMLRSPGTEFGDKIACIYADSRTCVRAVYYTDFGIRAACQISI